MKMKKLKVKDIQPHFYTEDERFYSSKEIKQLKDDSAWIPYKDYMSLVIKYVKLKNLHKRGDV